MRSVLTVSLTLLVCAAAGSATADPAQVDEKTWNYPDSWMVGRAQVPEQEPNDTCPGPQLLNCNDMVVPAEIAYSNDIDWYRLQLSTTMEVTIATDRVLPQDPETDTVLGLLEADCGTLIAEDDDSGPGRFSLLIQVLPPGNYNIACRGQDAFTTGEYRLLVACASVGAENDDCEDAVLNGFALPSRVAATISSNHSGAVDDYSLTGAGCTGYTSDGRDVVYYMDLLVGDIVNLTYTSFDCDGSMYVLTDCADLLSCVVGSDDTLDGEAEIILDWVAPATGRYYLILDNWTAGCGGDWRLVHSIYRHSVLLVNPQGTGHVATIQEAINLVGNGGEVLLADGTYVGEGNRDLDFLGKDVTLRSESGNPEDCVIDCQGTEGDPHTGILSISGGSCTVEGITIRNGHDAQASAINIGNGSPTISNCIIEQHVGDAIVVHEGAPRIEQSTIQNNDTGLKYTADGISGPVPGAGGPVTSLAMTLDDCVITGNQVGVSVLAEFPEALAELVVQNSSLVGNDNAIVASALADGRVNLEVDTCVLSDNHGSQGSALQLVQPDGVLTDISLHVRDCRFERNLAAGTVSPAGGAISAEGATLSIERTLFAQNVAQGFAPAVARGGAIYARFADVTIDSTTFAFNTATDEMSSASGAHIHLQDGIVRIDNSILAYGNGAEAVDCVDGSVVDFCCDVWGNEFGDTGGCLGTPRFRTPPRFCDAENGDFGLADNSKLVDYGSCGQIGAFGVGGCGPAQWEFDVGFEEMLTNIEVGIDATVDGDVINLVDDYYLGSGNRDNWVFTAILIRAANGEEECTIDCEAQSRALVFADPETGNATLEGVTIRNGLAEGVGGAIACATGASPTIRDCRFLDNRTYSEWNGGGGAVNIFLGSPTFVGCTFEHNSVLEGVGGAIRSDGGAASIVECTFYDNYAWSGSAMSLSAGMDSQISNSIIAFNRGGSPVDCWGTNLTLSCTDIFGNEGGDWDDSCVADHAGESGNIHEDPLFCDPENGDLTLAATSPCLPGQHPDGYDCGGVIGAHGPGCGAGLILVIDDTGAGGLRPEKRTGKAGAEVAPGYLIPSRPSVLELVADLESWGSDVTVEASATTDPQTWSSYDLVVSTSGGNAAPVSDAMYREALVAYVGGGGKLLIEGGELGYDATRIPGYPGFAAEVLHVADWTHDESGDVTVFDEAHYIMSYPNTMSGPISVAYTGYGDHDAVLPTADAAMVGSWSDWPGDASIVAFDPNQPPEGGQIVYLAFNYARMEPAARRLLLENATTWLLRTEVGDASVTGRVTLLGEADHSGVKVEAVPGGGEVLTDSSGDYALTELLPGTYTIQASKDGWTTEGEEVVLVSGQHETGLDLLLLPIVVTEHCRQPALPIPDNDPQGVTDDITFALGGGWTVEELEVYVDITHSFRGDLIVRLASPSGTIVTLHDRSGGGLPDLSGWYPSELDPTESLDILVGEDIDGTWQLQVSDHAAEDTGTLDEWCLRVTYADASAGVKACCLPDESCLILDEASCVAQDGNWHPEWTSCDPNPCETPTSNAGGALIVHATPLVSYTMGGTEYCEDAVLEFCPDAIANLPGGSPWIWWVAAVFPDGNNPSLAGVSFGIEYDSTPLVLIDQDHCGDLELDDSSWPAPGTGTVVTWSSPETGTITEVYWFAGYAASGIDTEFCVVPHPTFGATFIDDSVPSVEEPVDLLGCLGFNGNSGYLPCPGQVGLQEVCCLPDGSCVILSEDDCLHAEGSWHPEMDTCEPNPCSTSGVEGPIAIPSEYRLYSCRPNPFNPATTIRFDLPERTPVTLEIFDVSGRLVRRLADHQVEAAGSHMREWDGTDGSGRPVAAGIYSCRFVTERYQATSRMVLLK